MGRVTVNQNLEPRPKADVQWIWPPIDSHSRWLIARPRPDPPYRRVIDESTCENACNASQHD